MFLYKFNEHTGKYYKYDTDDVNIFTPMFDESLHDNSWKPTIFCKRICMYCYHVFPSRNQLFHHLGFMNIDITTKNDTPVENGYDIDMGDYGLEEKTTPTSSKRRIKQQNIKPLSVKKKIKKTALALSNIIDKLHI